MAEKNGIAIAGNLLVDIIKIIDSYPQSGMLSSILSQSTGVGGCVPNTAIDIKKIDAGMTVKAVGKIGDDGNGQYLLLRLKENGINTDGVKISEGKVTSYSDVMTVKDTGARTFFHARGVNSEFGIDDIDIDGLDCRIFHLGYALLLDSLDAPDDEYGTKMARVLAKVRSRGIKTSIDVVSESGSRFKAVVMPSLKHCDYVIINEIEAQMISGIELRDEDGALQKHNLKDVCLFFKDCGVKQMICIHFPEGAAMLNISTGKYTEAASLLLPSGFIKGTVGAGDAFCAGMLYCLYKDMEDAKCLRYASAAAAACLSEFDSVSGLKSFSYLQDMDSTYKRGKL